MRKAFFLFLLLVHVVSWVDFLIFEFFLLLAREDMKSPWNGSKFAHLDVKHEHKPPPKRAKEITGSSIVILQPKESDLFWLWSKHNYTRLNTKLDTVTWTKVTFYEVDHLYFTTWNKEWGRIDFTYFALNCLLVKHWICSVSGCYQLYCLTEEI